MGGFGQRLAQGLLQGASNYYAKVDERQQEEKRLDGVMMRERALAELRNNLAKDQATHQGGIQRQNTAAELEVRGQLAAKDDQRAMFQAMLTRQLDNSEWTRRESVQFQNKMKELGQRNGYDIAMEKMKDAMTLNREAAADGREDQQIDDYFIDGEGNLVGVTKGGEQRMVGSGLRPAKGKSDDDTGTTRLPPRTGAAPSAAPPALARPGAITEQDRAFSVDVNRLSREYGKATPATHPGLFVNGKKIPFDQARQRLLQAYGR